MCPLFSRRQSGDAHLRQHTQTHIELLLTGLLIQRASQGFQENLLLITTDTQAARFLPPPPPSRLRLILSRLAPQTFPMLISHLQT